MQFIWINLPSVALLMGDPDFTSLITSPERIGVIGLLGLIIVASYRRWIVWGWIYDQQAAELKSVRDELEAMRREGCRAVEVAKVVQQQQSDERTDAKKGATP